jgi:hypothetical protein
MNKPRDKIGDPILSSNVSKNLDKSAPEVHSIEQNQTFGEQSTNRGYDYTQPNQWSNLQPLDQDEIKKFKTSEELISNYLQWGKMDADLVDGFRQSVAIYGERYVADLGRSLAKLHQTDISQKADAERVIENIDILGYFALTDMPAAQQVVEHLALRPVEWNNEGQIKDALQAVVTFEAFDLYARRFPKKSLDFIKTIDHVNRPAYFTHYAYGRKLAGISMESIDQELRLEFGSPELAILKTNKGSIQ